MIDWMYAPTYTQLPPTGMATNSRVLLQEKWKKYLLQRAMSVYEWKMPKLWMTDYFKYLLYGIGFVSVIYTYKYGWIPQRCGLGGYNLFENPDRIIINNQFVSGIDRKIGNGCVLFHFNPDYSGVADIIESYAIQLAEMELTIYSNLQNTKISYVMSASDKAEADKISGVMTQVLNGEPAVVVKNLKGQRWDNFSQNVKQNYVVSDLLVDMRKILNAFNTEFGIPNSNTEKKERLVRDEVNSNNVETESRAEMWLNSFQKTCDELNAMAGETIMSVDWSRAIKEAKTIVLTESKESERGISNPRRTV